MGLKMEVNSLVKFLPGMNSCRLIFCMVSLKKILMGTSRSISFSLQKGVPRLKALEEKVVLKTTPGVFGKPMPTQRELRYQPARDKTQVEPRNDRPMEGWVIFLSLGTGTASGVLEKTLTS